MAKITWVGEDEGGIAGPSFTTWQNMKFDKGKPIEITDLEIITKAKRNRFFKVEDDPPKVEHEEAPVKRGPGRPPGSGSRADVHVEEHAKASDTMHMPRRIGDVG